MKPDFLVPSKTHQLQIWLGSAQRAFDRYSWLVLLLLAGFLSLRAWIGSQAQPLWFDELLGLSAATVPRIRDLLPALASSVDINPPLYHILQRFSVELFGYSATTARLPAFAAMLVFLLCIFLFVARRLAPSFGVLAVLLILNTPVISYTWEARPYALELGLVGLAMLAYQIRIERKSIVALVALFICCGCLPLTHYYGVLVIGAFLGAEILRTFGRRQIDWQVLFVILVAPALILFMLRNLISAQKAAIAHLRPGGLYSFIAGYNPLSIPGWVICVAIIALSLGIWVGTHSKDESDRPVEPGFLTAELALAVTLLLLPFVGAIATKITRAYVPRYFMPCCAGYAVLICYLLATFRRRCAAAALLLGVALIAGLCVDLLGAIYKMHDPPALANLGSTLGPLGLPVVFQDAKDYLLARELNPEMEGQFFYAAEPELALKMTGTDTDDKLMLAFAKFQRVQVWRLADMSRKTQHWIVAPGSFGWLVPCLTRMGVNMRLVQRRGPLPQRLGRMPTGVTFSGFEAELPSPESMVAPWCEPPPIR